MENRNWYQQQQLLKRSSISAGTTHGNYGNFMRFNDGHINYGQQQQPFNNSRQQRTLASQQQRSSYYETHYPLYNCDWSNLQGIEVQNIALSTYREDPTNKIQILHGFPNYDNSGSSPHKGYNDKDDILMDGVPEGYSSSKHLEGYNLYKVSEVNVNFPVTHLQWDPSMTTGNSSVERLATSSECLRIYEVETDQTSGESKLQEKLTLAKSRTKQFNQLPPLTSFDWNKVDSNEIITGSIDTTCTLWDLSKSSSNMAKTQLIAHDSEVFDVQFLHGSKYLFSSCGNDGSVRVFDLRSLERSTVVYEPQSSSTNAASSTTTYLKPQPLLKLAASNCDVNHVAALEANSNRILMLDLRYTGLPVKVLDHHSAPVNSILWHPTKNYLLSGADDCQAFIYDLNNFEHVTQVNDKNAKPSTELPILNYADDSEINNVTWNADGEWIGVVAGKGFQLVSTQ